MNFLNVFALINYLIYFKILWFAVNKEQREEIKRFIIIIYSFDSNFSFFLIHKIFLFHKILTFKSNIFFLYVL